VPAYAGSLARTLGLTKTALCAPPARAAVSATPELGRGTRFPLRVAPGFGGRSLTFLRPTDRPNPRHWVPSGHVSFVTLSTEQSRLDIAAIHAFLTNTYWSPGIPLATVARAVKNSICVGAYSGPDQVGFARVVSDKATFAYLADVYVLEAFRGKGLSVRMLEALFSMPELQGLRRMMLATRDAHALYARFGFAPLAAPGRFMERHNPNAYAPPPSAA